MPKTAGPPAFAIREARELVRYFRTLVGDNPLVLEIGCNDGMHTRIFLEEFQGLTIHCFEPDPRPRPRWDRLCSHDPRAHYHALAIASQNGRVPWFASGGTTRTSWLEDWDLSGSIRAPKGHLQMSPWVTFQEKPEGVEAVRLDDWVRNNLPAERVIDLVFADVQGAESDMVAGGAETFRDRVRYLWSEYYNSEIYAGQKDLAGIMAMLGSAWELVKVERQDFLARNTRLP